MDGMILRIKSWIEMLSDSNQGWRDFAGMTISKNFHACYYTYQLKFPGVWRGLYALSCARWMRDFYVVNNDDPN